MLNYTHDTGVSDPSQVPSIYTARLADGWHYAVYAADTNPAHFGRFALAKRLWDRKRGVGRIPDWKDFSLTELEPWWGWMTVEDILPGKDFDSRYRLWGSKVAEHFDVELTGDRTLSCDDPVYSDFDRGIVRRVLSENLVAVCWGPASWLDGRYTRYADDVAFLHLPLAGDGRTADKLFSIMQELEPGQSPLAGA